MRAIGKKCNKKSYTILQEYARVNQIGYFVLLRRSCAMYSIYRL
jgi:hypothetical protein